jgi:predicted transcriptional regulator
MQYLYYSMAQKHNPDTESVRLDKGLVQKVRALAQAEGRWLSAMFRVLVEEALAQREYLKRFAKRALKQRQEHDEGDDDEGNS